MTVDSFDESEVIFDTDWGDDCSGEGLHIKELNLEAGTMHIEGLVQALQYTGDTFSKRQGFLGRLFR